MIKLKCTRSSFLLVIFCLLITQTSVAFAACGNQNAVCSATAPCCSGYSCTGGVCFATTSCRPVAYGCSLSSECCSNVCSSGRCADSACRAQGSSCNSNLPCCSGLSCSNNVCSIPCSGAGSTCSTSQPSCCAGLTCIYGQCMNPTAGCQGSNASCTSTSQCCSGLVCSTNKCITPTTCSARGGACTISSQCCSGLTCFGGKCGYYANLGELCGGAIGTQCREGECRVPTNSGTTSVCGAVMKSGEYTAFGSFPKGFKGTSYCGDELNEYPRRTYTTDQPVCCCRANNTKYYDGKCISRDANRLNNKYLSLNVRIKNSNTLFPEDPKKSFYLNMVDATKIRFSDSCPTPKDQTDKYRYKIMDASKTTVLYTGSFTPTVTNNGHLSDPPRACFSIDPVEGAYIDLRNPGCNFIMNDFYPLYQIKMPCITNAAYVVVANNLNPSAAPFFELPIPSSCCIMTSSGRCQ